MTAIAIPFSLTIDTADIPAGTAGPTGPTGPAGSGGPARDKIGSTLALSGTTSIVIAAGSCLDESGHAEMAQSSALTKSLASAWAVGSTNGGLDTGTKAANACYNVFRIKRSDTGIVDAVFSLSIAPTLPANYDSRQFLGSVLTDGSGNIRDFVQVGKYFRLKASYLSVSDTAPGTSAVLRTLLVPTGRSVLAIVNALVFTTSGTCRLYISDPAANDEAPSYVNAPLADLSTAGEAACSKTVMTDSSGRVRTRFDTAPNQLLKMATLGWFDL